LLMLALGAVLTIYALILDFTKATGELRGYILILGLILLILGVFKLPHKKHTKIVNMVFLFPMVFTFAVTVIIPFILGVIWSYGEVIWVVWNYWELKRLLGVKEDKPAPMFPFVLCHGTGSYPLPPHGLHLSMRQMARASPLNGPCFRIACLAYSEQVGVKRQEGGVKGEMNCR